MLTIRLQPSDDRPIRLATDPVRKTCWMYTESSIYELVVKDEDRDVWKIYLSRQNWDLAKRHAKVNSLPLAVHGVLADFSSFVRLNDNEMQFSDPKPILTLPQVGIFSQLRATPNHQRASRKSYCVSSTRTSETLCVITWSRDWSDCEEP